MKTCYLIGIILFALNTKAQTTIYNTYQSEMDLAYQQYPDVPKGMLEAISFTTTHFSNITDATPESCFGLPHVYGVMGLTQDGQGYFKNNLSMVSRLSGYSKTTIKSNPETGIIAYAAAYDYLLDSLQVSSIENQIKIIEILSEIPQDNNVTNNYALDCHTYSIYTFLNNTNKQQAYNFPNHNIDLEQIFGANNLAVLSSSENTFGHTGISNPNGLMYEVSLMKTAEYGPALWVATPTCNYSSRSGTPISAVTIHTIQGSYAGAISWAQNCSAGVSYHYVVRSSDGQITQMLLEADKGWHIGSENPYCIGIEHEGYVDDPSWYTVALYAASADLCRDITQSGYGINPLRTYFGDATTGVNVLGACTKIKGHQHYPNNTHTDPGINWDWEGFYKLINNTPSYTTYSAGSGNLYDSGGATGNYTDDERELYLIQPINSDSVTATFNSFDIEQDWDFLFIYDGTTPNAPLIGKYTGTVSPGTINSTGGDLLLEFRSDCATSASGWEIAYTSIPENYPPVSSFSITNTAICQGDSIPITNTSTDATSYIWTSNGGTISNDTSANPSISFTNSGSYTIYLEASGPGGINTSSQTISVTIDSPPIAGTFPNSDTVYLPNGVVAFTNTSINSSSYTWYFGDGNTSTDLNPWNEYTNLGDYDITLIASSYNCPNDTATISIVVAGYVSIENIQFLENLNIYPNPTSGKFYINFNSLKSDEAQFSIYSASGKLAHTFNKKEIKIGDNNMQFDLNLIDIATGYYFLKIEGQNNNTTLPLIYHKH
jgi:PKD repeat protein